MTRLLTLYLALSITYIANCKLHYYLYDDGTFSATCDLQNFVQRKIGSMKYCDPTPVCTLQGISGGVTTNCSNSDDSCVGASFHFQNHTCNYACFSPFIARIEGKSAYCDSPCIYLYANGTCSSTCDPQNFVSRVDGLVKYCDAKPICTLQGISGGVTTNCSNSDDNCVGSSFHFQNHTCNYACFSPFVPRIEDQSAYCDSPCNSSAYLYPNGTCSATCDPQNFVPRVDGLVKYCDAKPVCTLQGISGGVTTNCSNSDDNCVGSSFHFQNHTCNYACFSPFIARVEDKSAYCDSPCNSSAYLYANGTCSLTCDTQNFVPRVDNSVNYCDPKSTQPTCTLQGISGGVTTNCSNSEDSCVGSSFHFQNHTCNYACFSPFIPRIEGNSAYCDSPCNSSAYLYADGTCSPNCDPQNFVPRVDGLVKYCDLKPTCELQGIPDGATTNCFNSDDGCVGYSFHFENLTCNSACFSPLIPRIEGQSAYCETPCDPGSYRSPNGSCTSVNLQIYIRYNISLDDFNQNNGSEKFVSKVASVLDISSSAIQILKITEGSTIIEAQVAVAMPSDTSVNQVLAQAQTLNSKFSQAATNNGLIIFEQANILNYDNSIQVSTSSRYELHTLASSEDSDSSEFPVGLAVGLAIVGLLVVVSGFLLYRRWKVRKLLKVQQSQESVKGDERKVNIVTSPVGPCYLAQNLSDVGLKHQQSL